MTRITTWRNERRHFAFTWPVCFPHVSVRFGGFHPGEGEVLVSLVRLRLAGRGRGCVVVRTWVAPEILIRSPAGSDRRGALHDGVAELAGLVLHGLPDAVARLRGSRAGPAGLRAGRVLG